MARVTGDLFYPPRTSTLYVKTVYERDLRVIVADQDRKRLSASAIHNNIVDRLGPNIVGYSTITRCLREMKFSFSTGEPSDADDRKRIDDPIKPFCPLSMRVYLRLCGSFRDSPTSLQRLLTVT
jgi:hypothetical protein